MTKDAIILVLSCLGLAQALFLSIYLLTDKKGNRSAKLFLAILLMGLTIRIGKSVLNEYLLLAPWQRNLGISGILLVGPSLWFYGRILLKKEKSLDAKNYLQLIPFFLFAVFCTLIPNDGSYMGHLIYLSVFAHLALYIGFAVQLLFRSKTNVTEKIWKWYRNLVIGIGLIWLFYIGHLAGIFPYYIGGAIFFSLLVYSFSFLLLKKSVFELEKYKRSSMDRATSTTYLSQLKRLFEMEEIYLNSTLSLSKVAKKLQISSRELSQVINENQQQNFSEFVNGYRILKAKKLLADPDYAQEKIATIAYDCGFGNVTSFNIAFKSVTKFTPTQYRNQFSMA